MDVVRRALTITTEQDAFLRDLEQNAGWTASQVVRMALDALRANPPSFLPAKLTASIEKLDCKGVGVKG